MTKQFATLVLGLILAAVCVPLAAQTYSFQSFSYPNATWTCAQGINNRGAVVGWVNISGWNSLLGFKRDANGVLERPFDADPATSGSTMAYGITDHGVVVGSYRTKRTTTGFLLYHGVFTYYNAQPGWNTRITGINNRGDFVGVASKGPYSYGFINSNGVATKIQCPNNSTGSASPGGIAADGTVVGTCTYPSMVYVAFIRGPAGRYKIIQIPNALTFVNGINNLAHQVVGTYIEAGVYHGFVYDYITDIMTTVDYPGAYRTEIAGINSHGVIVGMAIFSGSGWPFGFIGTPQ